MSSIIPDGAPRPRLCKIKKWEGFTGYGFNLHAEKGKAGQYIGKVDPNSPAQLAGLKESDRIVEVNGVNIGNENHGQVVQRIKSMPNETHLLVVDHEADEYYKDLRVVVRGDMANVLEQATPDRNPFDGHNDNHVADRTSTHSSHSAGSSSTEHSHHIRLCHLKIWPDFQGYGFNLHAEKNKPGQYIGKVDDNSPAQAAGLREKDRILEVNGESVIEDNHQNAVIKIKRVPNEVKLLVVDREADEYFKSKNIKLSGDVAFIKQHVAPDHMPGAHHKVEAKIDNQDHLHRPRLIQLETWSDYNGYGFNMHSVKGKHGEYIGKVEHGSPAHISGLQEGDRILEVCGLSIENDAHNDVVDKIKAAGGRAQLLVVDHETDQYYKNRGITINRDLPHVLRTDCPAMKPQANGTAAHSSNEAEHPVAAAVIIDHTVNREEHEHPVAAAVIIDHIVNKDAPEDPDITAVVVAHTYNNDEREDRSRSASPVGHGRSRSPSFERKERSRSPSPDNKQRSRSSSPEHKRDSDAEEIRDDLDDYERIDHTAVLNNDNNNEKAAVINHDAPPRVPTPENRDAPRVPTPEPVVEIKREPEVKASHSPQAAPVTLAGIEFAASAEEARSRVRGRKKDVRLSQNMSAKEKYELFQRL